MKDFLKSVRFRILVGLLTVLVGFMIAAVYSGGSAPILAQLLSMIVEPIQKVSSNISGDVSSFFEKYLNAAKTYEENAALREENASLRRDLVDYEKIKHEYEQYRKISGVEEREDSAVYEPASVIAREHHANSFGTFTIDKGSLDDVKYHDPVVTEHGLVGYVVEVRLTSAKVMTILDININVAASNNATRDIGVVTGTEDLAIQGLCRMEYLPRESEVKVGDVIVTAGGDLFPKDQVIGEVVEITTSSRGNSLEATIRPTADISSLKDIFVITSFEGQGVENPDE